MSYTLLQPSTLLLLDWWDQAVLELWSEVERILRSDFSMSHQSWVWTSDNWAGTIFTYEFWLYLLQLPLWLLDSLNSQSLSLRWHRSEDLESRHQDRDRYSGIINVFAFERSNFRVSNLAQEIALQNSENSHQKMPTNRNIRWHHEFSSLHIQIWKFCAKSAKCVRVSVTFRSSLYELGKQLKDCIFCWFVC